jgi:hypothetical protein
LLTFDILPPANSIPAGLDNDGSVLTAATTHAFPIPSLLRLRGLKDIGGLGDLQWVTLARTHCPNCRQIHKQTKIQTQFCALVDFSLFRNFESWALRGLMDFG